MVIILPTLAFGQYKNPFKIFINTNSYEKSIIDDLQSSDLQEWQLDISKKEIKNVLDYYLLLPTHIINDSEIGDIDDGINERLEKIKIKDIKNGYLESTIPHQIALFKDRTNNRDIIVTRNCGAGCQFYEFAFLEFNSNTFKWTYVNDILPSSETYNNFYNSQLEKYNNDLFLLHILPRHGTEIKIINGNETWKDEAEQIGSLKWDGTKFLLIK